MHYYEHHIGDYAAATAHLSLIEDAIYCRMLRRYYLTESPLPIEIDEVARLVGVPRDSAGQDMVRAILVEFFTLADDGWHQKRCDENIAIFHGKQAEADTAREHEAERKRLYRERRSELFQQLRALGVVPAFDTTTTELVRMLSHGTGQGQDADGTAYQSQAPSTNPKVKAEAGDACPHSDIIELYHELLPANPRIKSWTGSRQANLRTRWREDAKRQSLDYWRRFFRHVAASPFLTGQVIGQSGRPFLAGLDWLVMPNNFAKVIENKYHDRSPA
jgi:uncharacterized protein YdaU (DUF1376 family)